LNAGKFDGEVDELWREWQQISEMARTPLLPVAEMYFSWQGPAGIARCSRKYSPTDSRQVLRLEIPAPPRATIQVDPHQMPCQLLIRKAVWHVGGKEVPVALKQGPNGLLEDQGGPCLSVYGPAPLVIQAPDGQGPAELEFEFNVLTGEAVATEIVGKVRARLDQARRAAAGPQMIRR
jgi:hypothetical protein